MALWLVPSVSALLVIVGFVAATAHAALLGFVPGLVGSAEYVSISGQFLADLAVVLLDLPMGLGTLAVDWPRSLFLAACTALVVVLVLRRPARWTFSSRRCRAAAPVLLVAAVVLTKFILLDGPLMRIDNLVVGFSTPSQIESPTPISSTRIEDRLADQQRTGVVANYLTVRAQEIWHHMKCSRVAATDCKQDESILSIRGEFLAHFLACCLLVALASVVVLKSSRSSLAAATLSLAILSCLSLPYAYGKLLRSTHYEFGILKLGHVQGQQAIDEATGFILRQDEHFVSLLTREDLGACPASPDSPAPHMIKAKLLQVANGEILSIREIRRSDVIEWKIQVELPCGDAGKQIAPVR